jgi:hypothetical protein
MPLDKKRRNIIKKNGERKAEEVRARGSENFTEKSIEQVNKEAETLEKDYVEVMTSLNDALEDTMDQYVASSVKILRDSYQFRPQGILMVLKEEEDRLRELVQVVIGCLEPIKDTAWRDHTVKAIKAIVDVAAKAIEDQYTRELNRKEKTN